MTAAALDARVLGHVRINRDVRADEIALALELSTPDVSAALRRLKRANAVRSAGNTRGTTYRVIG